jgi:hypothetical protein
MQQGRASAEGGIGEVGAVNILRSEARISPTSRGKTSLSTLD